ncbi:metal ABC transporter substrate-binding protein [Ornithinimicrobium flavum]|uniref:metal ABC transporter substrate-binding protein n=1 Tax=Ornithinimicrobium flavum TaxID=1288636 RepID=UPI00106F7CE1|nr:metal ABC transporter substrate-binding protein [Ornithinimicrobium flavum]
MARLPHTLLPLLPLTLALAACGGAEPVPSGATTTAGAATQSSGVTAVDEPLAVTASFYPLEYLTARVAGEAAEVSTLTRPGLDPHDVELSPREVGALGAADLVIYSSGIQPAVDRAVETQAQGHALDVATAADLLALGESEDEHADHGDEDPHFWLDPERYGAVALVIADRLAQLDPARAAAYEANAAAVVSDLEELDQEFADGLARCDSRELVTTHEAFGYLAQRYDLHQTGITGISPESEPSAARLAEISAQVREQGVRTVYAEPLLSDAIARTVAQETGARVLTLDPADGLTQESAGEDYLEIMRANLAALQEGLGCS